MTKIKTSHSQSQTYIQCPTHWDMKYNKNYKVDSETSALTFGSAFDGAIEKLLLGESLDTVIDFFNEEYYSTTDFFGKIKPVFDNLDIIYFPADFDSDILTEDDKFTLTKWADELGVNKSNDDPIELFKSLAKEDKNPYSRVSQAEQKFLVRGNWLSLRRKGHILLKAFNEQIVPKIKKVHCLQKRVVIEDPDTGDSVVGYADGVLSLDGYDKPVVIDFKSAAKPYRDSDLDLSDQLTLYLSLLSSEYDTNLCGYIVACKDIQKDTFYTCSKCKTPKSGREKTCAVGTGKNRCKGEFEGHLVINPQIQVIVQEKSEFQMNSALNDQANVILGMKHKVVYKNTSKCNNWYGKRCPFFDACHNNDYSGLKGGKGAK